MTLTPIEKEFSQILLGQLNAPEASFDLRPNAPVISLLHPKLIWKELELKHGPRQEAPSISLPGWYLDAFDTTPHAVQKYSNLKIVSGKPHDIFQFMHSEEEKIILELFPLGTAVLSKVPLNTEEGMDRHHHLLPIWLNYALSPELWGPKGKWTHFHLRLNGLLKKKNLLKEEGHPGYYLLKEEAQRLEVFGFKGSVLEKSYLLVLPWTFSLTALEKLEEIIQREF